jgi:hypothetical protein
MKGTIGNSRMARSLVIQAALTTIMAQEQAEMQKAKDEPQIYNWDEDLNKKKVSIKPCNKCKVSFFGLTKRKYCYHCQQSITRQLDAREADRLSQPPSPEGNRRNRY